MTKLSHLLGTSVEALEGMVPSDSWRHVALFVAGVYVTHRFEAVHPVSFCRAVDHWHEQYLTMPDDAELRERVTAADRPARADRRDRRRERSGTPARAARPNREALKGNDSGLTRRRGFFCARTDR